MAEYKGRREGSLDMTVRELLEGVLGQGSNYGELHLTEDPDDPCICFVIVKNSSAKRMREHIDKLSSN